MPIVRRAVARAPVEEQRNSSLSMQDFAELFSYQGTNYPWPLMSMGSVNEEEASGPTFAQLATSNGILFALGLARMQVFSQIRFQWTRFNAGAPTDLWGTDELRILERPWHGGTTADLLARMEQDATNAGNAFVRRLPRRLVRLRPEWMYVVLGSETNADRPDEADDVELAAYAYKPPGSPMKVFLPDAMEIAHYAPIPDPDRHFVGMSWITSVLRDVYGDNLMTDHKRAFLRNAATPNLAIKFDPAVTVSAVKEFKEIFEAEHKGAMNAYKTLFLGGGADPVTIGKDFRELDFAVTQGKAESRMASAAGVPPSWVGFSEGLQGSALNAGNFTAARRRFGDGTMQHLWANVAASLEPIIRRPDPQANLWFATKGVPFLRLDAQDTAKIQSEEAKTITGLVRDGFTAESAIAAVRAQDWSLLIHTGRVSVQLQTPGETQPSGKEATPQ